MQILVPVEVTESLVSELKRAGKKETGGLLFGEHIGGETFKIVGITIQAKRGTETEFMRDPGQHGAQLDEFFQRTGNDCERYNYFGEWHSHPTFAPVPSSTDLRTLKTIVEDTTVGVNFLVLVIVRLVGGDSLALSATAYGGNEVYETATVFMELRATVLKTRRRVRAL